MSYKLGFATGPIPFEESCYIDGGVFGSIPFEESRCYQKTQNTKKKVAKIAQMNIPALERSLRHTQVQTETILGHCHELSIVELNATPFNHTFLKCIKL